MIPVRSCARAAVARFFAIAREEFFDGVGGAFGVACLFRHRAGAVFGGRAIPCAAEIMLA